MDKDGSGQLTPAEVKAGFEKLGIDISDSELTDTIGNADVDGDGKISYQEFLAAWSK